MYCKQETHERTACCRSAFFSNSAKSGHGFSRDYCIIKTLDLIAGKLGDEKNDD